MISWDRDRRRRGGPAARRPEGHSALSAPARWSDWTMDAAVECGMLFSWISTCLSKPQDTTLTTKLLERVATSLFVAEITNNPNG